MRYKSSAGKSVQPYVAKHHVFWVSAQLQESEQAVREKEQQNQRLQEQLDQSMTMSQEAIQAANKRVEKTQQCIREKEEENQQLLQQLDQSLRAIQAANTMTEEAHQRTREKDEENHDLQQQIQQLQDQVYKPSPKYVLHVRCVILFLLTVGKWALGSEERGGGDNKGGAG